jgi:hypothetical protein
MARLRTVVDSGHRLDNAQRRGVVLSGLDQRNRILGKARAAEARTDIQEFSAGAVAETDAARDVLDVGADFFAQLGDIVDEGDLGARKAWAAYLMSSTVRRPVYMIGALSRQSGRWSSAITRLARSSSVPTTMRSGCLKSRMAVPSRRNSGLETTATSPRAWKPHKVDFAGRRMPRMDVAGVAAGDIKYDIIVMVTLTFESQPSGSAPWY